MEQNQNIRTEDTQAQPGAQCPAEGPQALGITRAMNRSRVRERKRSRNKHGFLAALLVLAMIVLVGGAAFLLKHYVVDELLPREDTAQAPAPAPEAPADPAGAEPADPEAVPEETPVEEPGELPAKAPDEEPAEEPTGEGPDDSPAGPEEAATVTPAAPALAVETDATQTLDLELYSENAILIDLETNTVIAEKEPDAKIYPASMTKVMTALVACEQITAWDTTFTMTQAIIDPLFLSDATMAGFVNGEDVSMTDLVYGALLPSGAEATEALALTIAGSTEGFVALMNEKAAELGLRNTHFVNDSGLHDEEHYTTVREMAVILEAAMANERCRAALCAASYTSAATEQNPEGVAMINKFLYRIGQYELGEAAVEGAKTGFTSQAMNCCASFGKAANGRDVVCVTAHAWTGDFCVEDHAALYTEYCGD